MINVLTKRVNVIPQVPFMIKEPINTPLYNVEMSIGDIELCLLRRAIVEEILPNGKTCFLTLNNFNKVNYTIPDEKPIEKVEDKSEIEEIKENETIAYSNNEPPVEKDVEENTNSNEIEQKQNFYRKNNKRKK